MPWILSLRSVVRSLIILFACFVCLTLSSCSSPSQPQRLLYNNPGLVVDAGVGLWAWPLPMDYDKDGDMDLVVSCPDVPFNGIWFFENRQGDVKLPVFAPPVRLSRGYKNICVSYIDEESRVLLPGEEFVEPTQNAFSKTTRIYPEADFYDHLGKLRARQWKTVDYEGDGDLDLLVGVGVWTDYGWDNAYDEQGNWTQGPLHGYVYLLRNITSTDEPSYAAPELLEAGGEPIDVYGMPSPNPADFDNDGDLDLICGEFVDRLTWFENIGSRSRPEYAAGRFLEHDGRIITMDLEMIVPVGVDWDEDGDVDLVVGQEDGRVALLENTGRVRDHMPVFQPPVFFEQEAHHVKFGALVTPYSVDWDNDGDEDLICGNTAGYIGFIENLDGGNPPRWAAPQLLRAEGRVIRIQAGPNGSIQGPCEAKWGYTTLSVADWDHDGLLDIIVNSIWGKVVWYRNIGTADNPVLAAAQPVRLHTTEPPAYPRWNWWRPEDNHLVTQWRTTPFVIDLDRDGLNDLVMLDHEGYLAFYERRRVGDRVVLLGSKRIFYDAESPEQPLRLNEKEAGKSGRRKICLTDWNGDGRVDLLVNSKSVDLYLNVKESEGLYYFRDQGPLTPVKLAGHTTSPTVVDWNQDGRSELLIGAEDGFLYYLPR